jgi:two-component system, OmpR family, phosphate regulon sensor histidine kinase PhoR
MAQQTLDLTSFRRTFALLILLVVLPSAGLSGFGVVAIINERAAVEKRLESAWSGRLLKVTADLRQTLESALIQRMDDRLVLTLSSGLELTDVGFTVNGEVVESPDPKLKAAVSALGGELSELPNRPVFFSVATPQATILVVALRQGTRVVGARISPAAIDALLKAATPAGELAHYELKPVKREVTEGPLSRLVSGVADVREALGPRELASVILPSPLQDLRLAAVAEGEDPVAQASTRNRAVYGVLLGIFYLTLAIGVIYTGRTLYREARLSRLKTDFVSLVSHELRTPLTSIRMFIDTLAMGRVTNEGDHQQVLHMLSKETERLSAMIERVLDWARIEGGRKRYDLHTLHVQELVDAAVNAFQAQRMGAVMKLSIEVSKDLPRVQVDRDALAGALLNLLQNAFKYTGEDKQISLRARAEGKWVKISVQDNGVGIPRGERKKIFERFYRVDNLLTRETEGSGLGLAIANRIIQAHGGKITVDSEVGRGSTFTIHLLPMKG